MPDKPQQNLHKERLYQLGRRFEVFVDEAFHVVRWAIMVGFVHYLEGLTPFIGFTIARWVLSALLFGYIASRFLLRPEIAFFGNTPSPSLKVIQFLLNFVICVIVFALVLWAIYTLSDAVTLYRIQN